MYYVANCNIYRPLFLKEILKYVFTFAICKLHVHLRLFITFCDWILDYKDSYATVIRIREFNRGNKDNVLFNGHS